MNEWNRIKSVRSREEFMMEVGETEWEVSSVGVGRRGKGLEDY